MKKGEGGRLWGLRTNWKRGTGEQERLPAGKGRPGGGGGVVFVGRGLTAKAGNGLSRLVSPEFKLCWL